MRVAVSANDVAQTPDPDDGQTEAQEQEQGVHRRAAGRVDLADASRDESLASGVEDQSRLRVGAGDQGTEGRGHAGEEGEEQQDGEGLLGHRDEGG